MIDLTEPPPKCEPSKFTKVRISRKWQRILAFGCSHGNRAKQANLDAVVQFREAWKPDVCIHLGDAIDTAAFRSGAAGSKDESEPVGPDLDAGIEFINRVRPTHWLMGNHEDRFWNLAGHHNAIVAELAQMLIHRIEDSAKKIHCSIFPYTGIEQGIHFGGHRYMHGVFFNEMAPRDHAEAYGNVVHAHTHRAGMSPGRRADRPMGYCVGTLADIPAMSYAKCRRATLAWSAGFLWGEFCDTQSVLWLHTQPKGVCEWRLPIV